MPPVSCGISLPEPRPTLPTEEVAGLTGVAVEFEFEFRRETLIAVAAGAHIQMHTFFTQNSMGSFTL
jgi:hypothetical protein